MSTKERKERNEHMVRLYLAGTTQQIIADRFNLTEARVGQILRKMGVTKNDRKKPPVSNRTAFVGVHLTPEVKRAVKIAADSEDPKLSVSAFIARTLRAELERRNIPVVDDPPSREQDVPLPLEG